MTYIPNGKNVIASRGTNKWGCPFYAPFAEHDIVLNQVQYRTEGADVLLKMPSQVIGQTEWMQQYNMVNEVLRYEGQIRDFVATENGVSVIVPLYRWQYGIRITATDFTEGTIYFENGSFARKLVIEYGYGNKRKRCCRIFCN